MCIGINRCGARQQLWCLTRRGIGWSRHFRRYSPVCPILRRTAASKVHVTTSWSSVTSPLCLPGPDFGSSVGSMVMAMKAALWRPPDRTCSLGAPQLDRASWQMGQTYRTSGPSPCGFTSVTRTECASSSPNCLRVGRTGRAPGDTSLDLRKNGFDARPHPGPLPQERANPSPRLGHPDATGGRQLFAGNVPKPAKKRALPVLSRYWDGGSLSWGRGQGEGEPLTHSFLGLAGCPVSSQRT
jgi:hypothetical protein